MSSSDLLKESLESCRSGWNRCFSVIGAFSIALCIDGLAGGSFFRDLTDATIVLGTFKIPRVAFSFTYCALAATFLVWAIISTRTVRDIIGSDESQLGDVTQLVPYRLWILSPIHPNRTFRSSFWLLYAYGVSGVAVVTTIHLAGLLMPDEQKMSELLYRAIGLPCLIVLGLSIIAARRWLFPDWRYIRAALESGRGNA